MTPLAALLVLLAASIALGGRLLRPTPRQLIVGGQAVSGPDEFPYYCSLRPRNTTKHICGATLLAPRLALTAAFCVNPPGGVLQPELWCGLWRLGDQEPGSYDALRAVHVITNEHYKATTYCSDLALLELNASAQHSRPIGGTLQPGEFDFQAGHPLTAVGFGYTQPPQNASGTAAGQRPAFPEVLQHVDLPVVPLNVCNAPDAYDGAVQEATMFCAGPSDASADTCGGDSGGPLVVDAGSSDAAEHRQAGIVSWGLGCAVAGFPGVYVRLDTFAGFIEQEGYCGCSSLAPNSTAGQPSEGCSAALLQAERRAGLRGLGSSAGGVGQAACYVIAPGRCPYSVPSVLHSSAAVALCSSDTNLTHAAELLPLAQSALPPGARAPGGEHRMAAGAMQAGCPVGPTCTPQQMP